MCFCVNVNYAKKSVTVGKESALSCHTNTLELTLEMAENPIHEHTRPGEAQIKHFFSSSGWAMMPNGENHLLFYLLNVKESKKVSIQLMINR